MSIQRNNMKFYQRYYLITVTNKQGKVVYTAKELSGHSVMEEMMMLGNEYPKCEVSYKFVEKKVEKSE